MNLALADRKKITKPSGDGGIDENSEEEVNRILRRLKTQNHQLTEVSFNLFSAVILNHNAFVFLYLGGWPKK